MIFPLPEPSRGVALMRAMNDFVVKDSILKSLVPYTADVFVFTYPVYLVVLYLRGVNKRNDYFKEAALMIFFSSMGAAIVNTIIQALVIKDRPELSIINKENLILSHLPTDPFPSDHAAVSAALAMATYMRGRRHEDPLFMKLSWFFGLASVTMGVSRVSVAVHRPTDVLAGRLVGVSVAVVLYQSRIRTWIRKKIIMPLIDLEKRIFRTVFKITQD